MKSLVNLENKYKILLKSDSEIFSEIRTNEDIRKKETNQSKSTNFEKIYDNFHKHLHKQGLDTSKTTYMKTQLHRHVRKFMNELVENKTANDEGFKGIRRNAVRILSNKMRENKQEDENENNVITEESYKDDNIKKDIIIMEKEKNYFGYDPKTKRDKEKYYQRIESLNKLNTKVLIDKDDNVRNNEINEIYYKFKKRKLLNLKNMSISPSINNNHGNHANNESLNTLTANKFSSILKEKESCEISRNKPSGLDLNARSISQNGNYSIFSEKKTYFDSKKILKKENYIAELFNTQYINQNEREISNLMKTTKITNSHSILKENSSLSNIKTTINNTSMKIQLPKLFSHN